MFNRVVINALLSLFSICCCAGVQAQDTTAARQDAVDRYLRAVPMEKMLEDTYAEMSKQLPQERRANFITSMRQKVRAETLEKMARAAMLKHFTADELNALADFYSSKHGASAMSKFGAYMADVMPPLMEEIRRAQQEPQSKAKK